MTVRSHFLPMVAMAPSPSLPLPRRQEEKPLKPEAPSSSSFFSSFADRWRAYSGSGATTAAGSATAASSSPSKSPLYSSAPPTPSAAAASNPAGTTDPARPATHLCVLVHGLWGRPSDWDVVAERLDQHKRRLEGGGGEGEKGGEGGERLRVLKSRANARRLTLDGIDVCASRLASEVRAAVAEERERFGGESRLERVSFVGHSMGGLIARAAAAELLDTGAAGPATLAGGLSPAHFVSVATPHLGCHAEAEATAAFVAATKAAAAATAASAEEKEHEHRQHPALIPLVSWIAGASPALAGLSSAVAPRLLAAAAARASASMGRSGPQFFLTDGGEEKGGAEGGAEGGDDDSCRRRQPPLLARLADPSLPALRALAAFESRTTFANSSGDHLVGWGNASLRDPRELPRGELRAAATAGGGEALAEANGGSWSGRFLSRRRRGAVVAKEGGVGVVLDDGVAAAFEHRVGRREEKEKEVGGAGEKEREVDKMLASLASLPWRRVDACFKGTSTPFLAHNHIQATHFFNEKVGRASADAIARAVVDADEELLRRRRKEKEDGRGES